MELLVALAAKSLLVAGGALLLLRIASKRSAADRSWIAHLGLAGLLLLPIIHFALPALEVEGPAFLTGSSYEAPAPVAEAGPAAAPLPVATGEEGTPAAATFPEEAQPLLARALDWSLWLYALPAVVLLLLTLIALGRLGVLKARANVLVDTHWLKALAKAQRRMGFKNGTALLTSNELSSPISWGLMRPVILLNTDATKAKGEAEAIIAHELAHVARLDWAKLMLSRVTVALFWYNPLVWLLAREAHQLREEAADDAVLAADIEDTEYANLLVGIARHECRGLLLGAHGVAPARNSLARRVKRVLDSASARAPGGWRWSSAAAFFAAGMAVPVAALNFVPPAAPALATAEDRAAAVASVADPQSPYYAAAPGAAAASTAVNAAVAPAISTAVTAAVSGAIARGDNDEIVMRNPSGGTITVSAPDARGRRNVVMVGPDGATLTVPYDRNLAGFPFNPKRERNRTVERAIDMKAVGASPEYVAAMYAASPQLRHADPDDLVGLKAVGVTPAYVQELASAGHRHLSADDLMEARALGIRGDYIRGLAAAGYRNLTTDQLTELRAIGVTPSDVERFRRAGYKNLSVDELVEMKAVGVSPEDLRSAERDDP